MNTLTMILLPPPKSTDGLSWDVQQNQRPDYPLLVSSTNTDSLDRQNHSYLEPEWCEEYGELKTRANELIWSIPYVYTWLHVTADRGSIV